VKRTGDANTPVALPPTAGLRVLVVEDEPRMRELLLDVIPDMGFPETTAVRSAEEARRSLDATPADILLLDLQLPGASGMELFEEVRRQSPHAQVIVLTGHGDLDAARAAIHLDVVDFLRKPCHLGELEVALHRARQRQRPTASPPTVTPDNSGPMTLAEVEREQIFAALKRHQGNRTAAAAELGISRRTLHYRLREYGSDA
jgi:DNA-binding NtrC family response regulator